MSGKQKVAAVRCAGYDQALIGKKLDLLMTAIGADTLIQPGMSVLIKPNLLSAKTPEEFTTTHRRSCAQSFAMFINVEEV